MKTCFIIMPIGQAESNDHHFYRKVYEMMIKPVVSSFGYEVIRADEIDSLGNINRDIIDALASSDLVIADLTRSNSNVFYELGIRLALLECGTIPIIREGERLPFDNTSYRAIFYTVELDGPDRFRTQLTSRIRSVEQMTDKRPDKPVHDVLSAPGSGPTAAEAAEKERQRKHEQAVRSLLSQLVDIESQIEYFRELAPLASGLPREGEPYAVGDFVEQWRHSNNGRDFVKGPQANLKGTIWKVLEIAEDYVHLELVSGKYGWGYDGETYKHPGYSTKFESSINYRSANSGCKGNEQILKEWRKVDDAQR
jgi:hypothetical protein